MCLYNDPYDVPEGGNDPAPAKGCGGNIYTTSIVLSSLSLIGVGLLLIKRFKEEK